METKPRILIWYYLRVWGQDLVKSSNINRILELATKLTPMNRLLNNSESEEALKVLASVYQSCNLLTIPFETKSWGWHVPPSWTCIKAEVRDLSSKVVIDGLAEQTRIFPYSPSINRKISKKELLERLMTDKNRPRATPFHFRNQYKAPEQWEWGFSVPFEFIETLTDEYYFVDVKVQFHDKDLKQLEISHVGANHDTYVLLGHFDHPGQLNDGLIGVLVAFEAVNILKSISTRYSYKALATMEILGSQLYFSNLVETEDNIKEALFLTCLSLNERRHYQKSFFETSEIDRIFQHLANTENRSLEILEHRSILGNDENILDSVGIDIPCSTFFRWPHPTYHTNDDNLNLLNRNKIQESLIDVLNVMLMVDRNSYPMANYKGVPRLSNSEYNLYFSPTQVSGIVDNSALEIARKLMPDLRLELEPYKEHLNLLMRNVLRMSNGKFDILAIADRTRVPFKIVYEYIKKLEAAGLVKIMERQY